MNLQPQEVMVYMKLKIILTIWLFIWRNILECKKQTLANLANFAYDPINYEFIKQLHLTDLFLSEISGTNEELIHFGLSGLCNLACGKFFV